MYIHIKDNDYLNDTDSVSDMELIPKPTLLQDIPKSLP